MSPIIVSGNTIMAKEISFGTTIVNPPQSIILPVIQ